MQVKDISLMAIGAMAAVTVMAISSAFFYTPKAQAQASSAAPAPGGVSMIVSPGNLAGPNVQGGTIALQDSVNRKVTIAPYAIFTPSVAGTAPSILVGATSTITY